MANYTLPNEYNPLRRLAAAVTLCAVRDYLQPHRSLGQQHRQTAAEFVHSPVGRDLIREFIPREDRVNLVLGGVGAK